MPKNIVICCDGTGNEFGNDNSNVVKLYSTLHLEPGVQTAYYHPGVGTMGAKSALSVLGKAWTRGIGLAFGYGLSENISDAYLFLMREFQPDDRIYIFGFSRGAYTARALAGMLHMFGLLTEGNQGLIPYALRLFKTAKKDRFLLASQFKGIFSRREPCHPYFLGLWDTVSSVGWILDAWRLPYTAKFPDIPIVRHALSIDERRAFFRQNPIFPPDPRDVQEPQDLKQVWFAGVHSDVGGSYPEAESGLSKLALRWMLCEAGKAGLLLTSKRVQTMFSGDARHAAPSATAEIHHSLKWYWWPAEFLPKRSIKPVSEPGQTKRTWRPSIRFNLFRRRTLPLDACLHQSVVERWNSMREYRPGNLLKEPNESNYAIEKDDPTEFLRLSGALAAAATKNPR
jgi:uncharacterized protein (DUF2235 family)